MALRSSAIADLVNNRIDKRIVPTLESNFELAMFAEQRPLQRGDGDTEQLTFWNNPALNSAPSDEYASGNANSLTHTIVTVSVNMHADDYSISEFAEFIDKTGSVLSGHTGRMIYWVRGVYDIICRDALSAVAATSVRVANGATVGTTLTALDSLNIPELNFIFTLMQGRNVEAHSKAQGTGVKYPGVYHSRPLGDLRADTGGAGGGNEMAWNDWARRARQGQLASGDVGAMIGIKPVQSTNIQRLTDANGVVYYQNFVFGDHAFVVTSINGLAAPPGARGGKPLVRVIPKEYGHATVYGNVNRIVGKFYAGANIIDSTRMVMHQTASAA